MLQELRVENLVLMERAELCLAPGLNVITGETGAGKTLVAHALDLLLGGRARRGVVRRGAREAYVEGVFTTGAGLPPGELLPTGAEEVVLARRVWPDGRTRAYICGRSASLADLRELAGALVSFYGQHEHRKLTLAAAQLEVLDAFCGPDHLELVARLGRVHERVRDLEQRLGELSALDGARERELDLVAFELGEIDALAPAEAEEAELAGERERLRHIEALVDASTGALEALVPEEGVGVRDRLVQAARRLEDAAGIDPSLGELAARLAAVAYETDDLAADLRAYAHSVEATPGRLEEVEERLAAYARLQRKYGGSTVAVLEHAERCRERLEELGRSEVALQETRSVLEAATAERDGLATEVSARRRGAAGPLAGSVRSRLTDLAMPEAEFDVELRPLGECGPSGAETVEMVIAPNPGHPAAPLREIASGGELSRVMLALLGAAHEQPGRAEDGRLLVFDEIDAGIGGRTARAVGSHLRTLARDRQILCITHLPQVAALASRHFTIAKDSRRTPATTTVAALEGERVVGEIVRMLGAGAGDTAASQHARELLRAA